MIHALGSTVLCESCRVFPVDDDQQGICANCIRDPSKVHALLEARAARHLEIHTRLEVMRISAEHERDAARAELAEAVEYLAEHIDLSSFVCNFGECVRVGTKETDAPRGASHRADAWCDEHAPEGARDTGVASVVRWFEARAAKERGK